MLAANNFTAMANKTTPKILRITLIPCFPKIRSIFPEDFNLSYDIVKYGDLVHKMYFETILPDPGVRDICYCPYPGEKLLKKNH